MIDIRLSDNLELMAEMQDNTVDLIYCDILYGTGRKFKDYQDLKPKREVIDKHYIPRIKEMHRILKDTGSIYLHMDTRINHWLRCILDDIFGYDNFVNDIIFKDIKSYSKNKKGYQKEYSNILFYKKTNKIIFNGYITSVCEATIKRRKYKHTLKGYSGKEQDNTNKLTKMGGDLFIDINRLSGISKEINGYATQKPKSLIERIIKASSNEGDLVADFYAGSFTTAEVCKDLNRNFIGCDISEKAVAIGLERTKY
jgi:DNA modification methylase